MEEPYGYIIEQKWDSSYSNGNKDENGELIRYPLYIPWHLTYSKKFYKLKSSAEEAIMQMKKSHSNLNIEFRIIPLYLNA